MTTAPPSRPRALLFDWDNTLVDSWGTIHAALVITFEAMGHAPWTMAETKLRVARSLRDSFPALFGERWEEARQLYLDTFTAIHLERLKPVDGAEALLEELAAAGFYLGVVSNKTGAGRSVSASSSAPAMPPSTSRWRRRCCWRSKAAVSPAPRPGTLATPRSISNVPRMPVVSACCSAPARSRRKALRAFHRHFISQVAPRLRSTSGGCDSPRAAHLL